MSREDGAHGEDARMRDLVARKDWAATPLGPADAWPQSLKTMAELCLASRFPSVIFWGPERVQIYNDGYRVILGAKHPDALGQRAADCWAEIWDLIRPMMNSVFETGEAVWVEASPFCVERSGYLEEAYFTFSYTPVREESGAVGGIFETVTEVTSQILAHRRLATLRDLGAEGAAQSIAEACTTTAATLAKNAHDIPFALLYVLGVDGETTILQGQAGMTSGMPGSLWTILPGTDDPWRLAEARHTSAAVLLHDLEARIGPLPGGPWPENAQSAVVLPIEQPGSANPFGFLVAGVSPRRALDEEYRDFLSMAAQRIARTFSAASAYMHERDRAEKLLALDRAKTVFFNNVSHEFRTPLTLLLAPVEDALARPDRTLAGSELEAVHRSAVRLLRLVNSLLDFARIEAGRMQVSFAPVDLAALTSEIAASFRPLVERAGLTFTADCLSLPETVYVDVALWEKIVLNLLSNAYKFTLEGEIAIGLRAQADHVELTVRDTGCGIPASEMSRLFERFHRVEGASGRSFEGTGIGLSLIHEFVKLHGGSVRAESALVPEAHSL